MAQSFTVEGSDLQENLTFNWTIRDFNSLCNAAKSNPDETAKKFAKVEFTVGEGSIGIPTDWRFYLKWNNANSFVEMYLGILGPGCYAAQSEVYQNTPIDGNKHTRLGIFPKTRFARCNLKYSKTAGTISERGINLATVPNLVKNLVRDGELQLQIKFTVYYPSEINYLGDLSADLTKELDSALESDFTFVLVEDEGSENVIAEIKAHKSTLSSRCPYFAKMFASGMKETIEGKVTICDTMPKVMRILLRFIYTGVVDPDWISVPEELIRATNKYELEEFKKFLCEKVFFALTQQNVYEIWEIGNALELPDVTETSVKFMQDNFRDFLPIYKMTLREEQEPQED